MKYLVTIADIENQLCSLDTEYREALAHSLMELNYVSDSPLKLSMGTQKQQAELKEIYNKPLKANQIKEIINYISEEMKGDYQYAYFSCIASFYKSVANSIEKNERNKESR